MSRGIYRIPYGTGTRVEVTGDHLTHDPPTRLDLNGVESPPTFRIVAAARGVIRRVEDSFSESRPGKNPCNNNYVWIEHPNGEWTKYTHMRQGSVTGTAGLEEGDDVEAGTFLGEEGDVGCADGEHLHFEVGVPSDPTNPINDAGFLRGTNRIPRFCGAEDDVLVDGKTYRATVHCLPDLDFWPSPVVFGAVRVGQQRTRTVFFKSPVRTPLAVSFQPSPTSSVFRWAAFDRVLAADEEAAFEIEFRPRGNGIDAATLRAASSAPGSPHTLGISGRGFGGTGPSEPPPPTALTFSPRSLIFHAVPPNAPTRVFTIGNPTGASANLSIPPSPSGLEFEWQPFSGTLPSGATRNVAVTFNPTSSAIVQRTLVVTSNTSGSPDVVTLTGKGPGGF